MVIHFTDHTDSDYLQVYRADTQELDNCVFLDKHLGGNFSTNL
jgi:hypothetical protein